MTDRDKLITDHIPLVRIFAYQIWRRHPQGVDLEDLIQSGMIGLVDASNKFDSNIKVKFKTYAQIRIHGAIIDSLRDNCDFPRSLYEQLKKIEYAKEFLETIGRETSTKKLSKVLNMPEKKINDAVQKGALEKVSIDDSGSFRRGDYISLATDLPDALDITIKKERLELLNAYIDVLPIKERMVLRDYYFRELSLKELGRRFNFTESRASQILSSAIERLRSIIPRNIVF